MEKGWLIAFNEKYAPLAEVMVRSLLQFSKYNIQAITINTSLPASLQCSRVWPIFFSLDNTHPRNIWKHQSEFCMMTMFDTTAYLDVDVVVSPNIDEYMEAAHSFIAANNLPYPLFGMHPHDPNNHGPTMKMMGVAAKRMAHLYFHNVFGRQAIPFFQQTYDELNKLHLQRFEPPNSIETVLNCLLWKKGASAHLCDSDITYECFNDFIREGDAFDYIQWDRSHLSGIQGYHPWSLHKWHGCKNVEQAKKMLEQLKQLPERCLQKLQAQKPVIVRYA